MFTALGRVVNDIVRSYVRERAAAGPKQVCLLLLSDAGKQDTAHDAPAGTAIAKTSTSSTICTVFMLFCGIDPAATAASRRC